MSDDLPQGWAECTLGDIIKIQNGYAFPSKEFRESGIPLIRQGNLAGERVSLEKCVYLEPRWLGVKPDFILRKNDVLIGMSGSVGKLCIYNRDEPALQNQRTGKIVQQSTEFVDWRFVWEYLKTVELQLLEKGKGLGVLNVSATDIESLPFCLAPFDEQRRIVAKLEKLLGKVDTCQQRLAKIPLTLKRFRQSVLAAACSGRLTADWRENNSIASENPSSVEAPFSIPETWRWVKLPETGEMRRGKSRHRPRDAAFLYGGPYPFIQTGDIAQSGGKITRHQQTYSEAGLVQSRLWPEGTICITIAANIAESAILNYAACFPDSIVGIIADQRIGVPEYIEYFIRVAKTDLAAFAPATAQKNINIAILSEVLVPLAPLEEQREIVRRVEALFVLAEQIEARFAKAKTRVDQLTQSILAKAFRGELVPQDPNDEPASVLLERINAERTKGETEGKGGGRKRLKVNKKGKAR